MTHTKTEIKKSSGQILCVTIAYLIEISKIKDKLFQKILTQKYWYLFIYININTGNLFFGSEMGGQLIHGIDLNTGKIAHGNSDR